MLLGFMILKNQIPEILSNKKQKKQILEIKKLNDDEIFILNNHSGGES